MNGAASAPPGGSRATDVEMEQEQHEAEGVLRQYAAKVAYLDECILDLEQEEEMAEHQAERDQMKLEAEWEREQHEAEAALDRRNVEAEILEEQCLQLEWEEEQRCLTEQYAAKAAALEAKLLRLQLEDYERHLDAMILQYEDQEHQHEQIRERHLEYA